MNTSFDDQATSQSTNNDQPSETSSANNQSPHYANANLKRLTAEDRLLAPQQTLQQPNHLPQHQIPHHLQDSYSYQNPANHYHTELRKSNTQVSIHQQVHSHPQISINSQIHHRSASNPTLPLTPKKSYTGVDKLIIAAMMEDSVAALSQAAQTGQSSAYLPIGRGLGYFGSHSDKFAPIPAPSNKSELELYHLLERANLLNYFGTFLNFGGDDVQQLSDADEEEFLEIMSLVGMTQKPLHVRRLQKALIEWRDARELEGGNSWRKPISSTTNNCSARFFGEQNKQTSVDYSSARNNYPMQPPVITSANLTNNSADAQSECQYIPPHEILTGAPKRLRLMDDLLKKRYNDEESQSSDHCSHRTTECVNNYSNKETFNPPLTSSPISRKSCDDKEEDLMIEILEESQSDIELEETSAKTTSDSPSKHSHSKYARYKASLSQDSPNKLKA